MGIEVLSPLVYEGSPLISQAQADLLYATLAHTHTFASLTAKPTTLAGYGITDTLTLTVAGLSGTITASGLKTALSLVKADVGLGNVDNTSDVNKPVSTAQQTALNLKTNTANSGPNDDGDQRVRYSSMKVADTRTYNSLPSAYVAGEYLEFKSLATIGLTGTGYMYGLVITDKPWTDFSGGPARQTAQVGPNTYVRIAVSGEGSWSTWKRQATEDDLNKTSVGLANVDNTSDANKPVSTAQQTALNLKANLASPTFTGTVGGITSAMVGLGNVNNTSDANKPVSTATQTALDAKITGPASVTADRYMMYDGTTGKLSKEGAAASFSATAYALAQRDANGDLTARFFIGSYINTTDQVPTGTLTYLIGKFGDNYHNSATPAKVRTFLDYKINNVSPDANGNFTVSGGAESPSSVSYTYNSDGSMNVMTETISGNNRVTTYGYSSGNLTTKTVVYLGVTKTTTYTYTSGVITSYSTV